MLRIYLPSSTDLKLCSDVPIVDCVDTWSFVTVFELQWDMICLTDFYNIGISMINIGISMINIGISMIIFIGISMIIT